VRDEEERLFETPEDPAREEEEIAVFGAAERCHVDGFLVGAVRLALGGVKEFLVGVGDFQWVAGGLQARGERPVEERLVVI